MASGLHQYRRHMEGTQSSLGAFELPVWDWARVWVGSECAVFRVFAGFTGCRGFIGLIRLIGFIGFVGFRAFGLWCSGFGLWVSSSCSGSGSAEVFFWAFWKGSRHLGS